VHQRRQPANIGRLLGVRIRHPQLDLVQIDHVDVGLGRIAAAEPFAAERQRVPIRRRAGRFVVEDRAGFLELLQRLLVRPQPIRPFCLIHRILPSRVSRLFLQYTFKAE
jgi:hypothetical protein